MISSDVPGTKTVHHSNGTHGQGLKIQPNLPKFGGFGGGLFFKNQHCSHKIRYYSEKLILFIRNSVKRSDSTMSGFFHPVEFLNTAHG
jgi:hypothetical protein